jgi:hypothetical protein
LCAALGGQRALNEKMLVERTGLASLHDWFTRIPAEPAPLVEWVSGLRGALTA